MSNNFVETIVGAVVLLIATYFLYYAYFTTQVISNASTGYTVFAKFDRIDGLNLGGDVKISGIKIGKVVAQSLDPKTYQAVLKINIMTDVKLPSDTSAEIIGNGLLGEKYVALVPGSETDVLNDNSTIEFTQSSINIEGLIGKFMFNSATDGAKKDSSANKNDIGSVAPAANPISNKSDPTSK